jgi:hypothetical protein
VGRCGWFGGRDDLARFWVGLLKEVNGWELIRFNKGVESGNGGMAGDVVAGFADCITLVTSRLYGLGCLRL